MNVEKKSTLKMCLNGLIQFREVEAKIGCLRDLWCHKRNWEWVEEIEKVKPFL